MPNGYDDKPTTVLGRAGFLIRQVRKNFHATSCSSSRTRMVVTSNGPRPFLAVSRQLSSICCDAFKARLLLRSGLTRRAC
jgi:hypothetical protein